MSTKFRFYLTDAWSVALSHGHSAFRLLRIAAEIETDYDRRKAALPSLDCGRSAYLESIARCEFLTRDMLKISSACVAAFQAMMEGLINNAIASQTALASVKSGLSGKKGAWDRAQFERKWKDTLAALGQSTIEFESYNRSIYKAFRIPLIHPHDGNLASIDSLEFAVMRDGFRDGWKAYERLYEGLGMKHDPESWRVMCRLYGVDE